MSSQLTAPNIRYVLQGIRIMIHDNSAIALHPLVQKHYVIETTLQKLKLRVKLNTIDLLTPFPLT